MTQQLEPEGLETEISQAQRFCQIDVGFVKGLSTTEAKPPPKEDDLKPSRTNDNIPHLLDLFLIALISTKSLVSESSSTERTIRLKEFFVQDFMFSFTNEVVKTLKSLSKACKKL